MGTCLLCRSIPHLTIDSVNIIIDKPSSLTYRPHTLPKIHRYKTSAPDFSFLSAAIFHPRQLPAKYQFAAARLLSMGISGFLLLRG